MEDLYKKISISQLCRVIDLLSPCMDDYLYVYDIKNDYYYISSHALDRFALPGNSFHHVVETHGTFVYPPDVDILQEDLNALISGERESHNLNYRWLSKNKTPIWINCRGRIVRDNNEPLYMIGCINEIGASQKADNVSGLLGDSSLKLMMTELYPDYPKGFLLHIGLDDFKEINEKLGIEYGDMVLRHTAECISSCISPGQQIFRIVSDEFMVVDFLGGSCEEGIALYKRIRQSIDAFVEKNMYEAVFTISAGILSTEHISGCSYSNIMKLSEFTLNEAKRKGKNICYQFVPDDYASFLRTKRLTQLIRQAVNNDFAGFEAYFQPLVLTKDKTLYGAETLLRFHTEEGMISPGVFIPILEETGLIIPVGRWVLHQSLKACKQIQTYIPDFRISINVSYIQVMKSDIINEIISAVSKYELNPSTVIIELTESGLLVSNLQIAKMWSKLNEKGIQLALDDFGTGYSNFHYLHDLRPSIIKIDRSFTVEALANDYEYNLLSLMSGMVHNFNLKVCIEGIENQNELQKMCKLQPDYFQGFYFGKPCALQKFIENFVTAKI